MRMTPEDFFGLLAPAAVKICKEYNLYPSVCMAQAAIESTWGEDIIEATSEDVESSRATGAGGFNLFGRKAVSSDSMQKWEWTREHGGPEAYEEDNDHIYLGENRWKIKAWFKLYPSIESAIVDYCVLLTEEPCYAPVVARRGNRKGFIYALAGDGVKAGVYATNENYGPEIIMTIKANELDQYDKNIGGF